MDNFNWKEFVEKVEVIFSSPHSVARLEYGEIWICPSPYRMVGAYKFHRESVEDRRLIEFFENNGMIILGIIAIIECGLTAPPDDDEPLLFCIANLPFHFNDYSVINAAFGKGKALREEANAQFRVQKSSRTE